MIRLKRAYDPVSRADGARFLVERLWPRGVSKETLQIAAWLKEVAPSTALRKWFAHDPAKWDAFRERYYRELDAHPDAWRPLVTAARQGPVTFVYGSRDTEHNAAIALKEYVERQMRRQSTAAARATRAPR